MYVCVCVCVCVCMCVGVGVWVCAAGNKISLQLATSDKTQRAFSVDVKCSKWKVTQHFTCYGHRKLLLSSLSLAGPYRMITS